MKAWIESLNIDNQLALNLIWTVVIVTGLYLIKGLLIKTLHKHIENTEVYYKTKRVTNGIAFFLSFIVVVIIWLDTSSSLLTFLGLFSAGVALALKDILLNISGWLYIIIRQPFFVGDRIEISGIKGDVIDQNIFKFRVIEIGNWVQAEQSTGRIIHIPNYKIFTDPLANYSLGFEYIWDELAVLIPFEKNWRKAKVILEEVVHQMTDDLSEDVRKQIREASRKYMIFYNSLTPIVYTDVTDSGVRLTMRFICHPKQRRTVNQKIWEELLNRFDAEDDVEFGYPTMRRIQ